ncbi:hypothetical protein KIPB_013603, partial [Kipferlia bialata]|eukprot:g13603.t1
MVAQLKNDGHHVAAAQLAQSTMTPSRPNIPSDRLYELSERSLGVEGPFGQQAQGGVASSLNASGKAQLKLRTKGGPELVIGSDSTSVPDPRPPSMHVHFLTKHMDAASCSAFSLDGRYAATGSTDHSIKIIDTQRAMQTDLTLPKQNQ